MSIVKDCFDDPSVTLSVSPRELSMILTAMNRFQDQLHKGTYKMNLDIEHRWDELLDYIKDEALGKSYRVPVEQV